MSDSQTDEDLTRASCGMGAYGHTPDDLERLRMVVSETHPRVEFMLEADSEITYWHGTTVRRASELAGIADRCWSCFANNPEPWYRAHDGCREIRRPPYAEDCGAR